MAASLSSDLQNGHQQDFEEWLSSRMRELGLDEEVFGSYVKGILDSEDSNEADFKDALIGILEGMTDYPLEEVCNEILEKWKASRREVLKEHEMVKEIKAAQKKNKLAEIMEKQASTVSTTKPGQLRSDSEMKKLLVAQYGHESDEDPCSESDHDESCAAEKSSEMIQNVNAQSVADREKEKRDKMREENDQRKQQIKEAKEKQKQKAEERKDKEKKRTQKGERRTR